MHIHAWVSVGFTKDTGNWRAISIITCHINSAEMVRISEIHIVCVKFIVTLSPASLWSCAVFCRCFHKDSVLRGMLVRPPKVVSFQILPLTSKRGRFPLLLFPPSLPPTFAPSCPPSLLPSSLPFLSSSCKVLDYYFLIYKNISIAFSETLSFPLKLPIGIVYLPPLPQVPPWTDEGVTAEALPAVDHSPRRTQVGARGL